MDSFFLTKVHEAYYNNKFIVDSAIDEEEIKRGFVRLCSRLDSLENDEQRGLVLELLESYRVYSTTTYLNRLDRLMQGCSKSKEGILGEKSVGYAALLAPEDVYKTKSSRCVSYMMKDVLRRDPAYLAGINIYGVDEGDRCSQEKFIDCNDKLILVDDFVGTGDTAMNCIKDWESKGLSRERIIVCSICAHELGIERLKEEGIPIFFDIDETKHLEGKYSGVALEEKVAIMDDIEGRLNGLSPKMHFGYKKSEALITMANTPNNTFPVFWFSVNGEKPPFIRVNDNG